MSFHEVQFPVDISYGSAGGPGYSTLILPLDSGKEIRVSRWSEARRRYNVAYGIKSFTQLQSVMDFYIARQGAGYGFRYKDFLDFTTASDNTSAPAHDDNNIGTGDASETVFQMVKIYTSGPTSRTRTLTKPVTGTTLVGLDGVNQASGWTVNTTTGQITFTSAPGAGVVVSAGCEFDVPVRFGEEVDGALQASIEHFEDGSIDNIPLVEITDPQNISGEFHYGGGKVLAISDNYILSPLDGRAIWIDPTANNLRVLLPDESLLAAGGPYFHIYNADATHTVLLRDHQDVQVKDMGPQTAVTCLIFLNSAGNLQWVALDA
jgi:uncharacterized protein (TIGR02217 family)